ncbi:hypothetical protein CMK14_11975 [Candidatus Poribacteria bacterium]|nr:hypothetical protein [Candidatus Poribacteria bacterium]
MPIYDQSYQHWNGHFRQPRWSSWWVIASMEFCLLLQRKFVRLVVWVPPLLYFLVHGVQIYVANRIPEARVFWRIDPAFFKQFLLRGPALPGLFICLIAIFSGAGLIANDLRYNALQLYLSKPISWWDYLLGKITVMLMWLGLITVVPGLLLLSEHLLLADSIIFLKKNYGLLLTIPLFSLLIILPTSLLILALSSLTTNSRYAAVGFAALLVGTPVLAEVLSFVTRKEAFHLLSIWANYDLLGSYLFGLSPPYSYPWYLALLICLGIMGSSLWVLQKRIRAVQIVQ